MSNVAALILAGGTIPERDRSVWREHLPPGVVNRALLPLPGGKTMLESVAAAVRGAVPGARVLVAGDVPTPEGCIGIPGGQDMVDTLLSGIGSLMPHETRLLVCTADIPFVTAEAVSDVLIRAEAFVDIAFVYTIVEAARCRQRFPGMRRTTLHVKEGEFTGGNVCVIDPQRMAHYAETIRSAYRARKSIPGLARLLGPEVVARLLVHRAFPAALPLAFLERIVGERLLGGAGARVVVTPFAEIGADIDRPGDVSALNG